MSGKHAEGGRTFVRFNGSQRIEHLLQLVSFVALVVTGVPQRFNGAPWADWAISAMGGVDVLRGVHRVGALVLIGGSVYHFFELIYLLFVRKVRWSMLPHLQDGKDAIQMVLYFLGVRKERARFDRYDFRQKVEYLALIWGTLLMIFTGLCLWFPIQATQWISGEMIPAAKAAHGGEGLLALGSILVWHMYGVIFCPDIFPFDDCIFTGKISEERMVHEHPLELERILAAERARASQAKPAAEAPEGPAPTA